MAETSSPDTNPLAAGRNTSEWGLAKVGLALGAVLEVAALVVAKMGDFGVSTPWLATASMVIGGMLQGASILGYQNSRAIVKAEAIAAGDAAAAKVTTPAQVRAAIEGRPIP